MKIVKGDTVYLRSGKDVANMKQSRLEEALGISDPKIFQEKRAQMPMAEQIAEANKSKGVRGEVIRILPAKGMVVVKGLNMITKHQRPRSTGGAGMVQQGGRIQLEAPIQASRLMLVCPHCDKPTRVGLQERQVTRQTLQGEKVTTVRDRVCKQCKQVIARPTTESREMKSGR